jgi:hypothetical protein
MIARSKKEIYIAKSAEQRREERKAKAKSPTTSKRC